jgi:hypothetical protein
VAETSSVNYVVSAQPLFRRVEGAWGMPLLLLLKVLISEKTGRRPDTSLNGIAVTSVARMLARGRMMTRVILIFINFISFFSHQNKVDKENIQ